MTFEEYLSNLKGLISQLNTVPATERGSIVKQIKEQDRLYLETLGHNLDGQIIFTRHARSHNVAQKTFGFNPNAPIARSLVGKMAKAGDYSSALFLDPLSKARIVISPLIRTLQTAALIIPKNLKSKISIETYLSEDSDTPSGIDLRSQKDYKILAKKAPLISRKRFMCFLSSLYYRKKTFADRDKKRADALKVLADEAVDKLEEAPQALAYEGSKIEDMSKLITNTQEKDLWLIGHGKNFRHYFKQVFGLKLTFDYSETKTVYRASDQSTGEQFLYIPPYSLAFDSKTGAIIARYSGFLKGQSKSNLTAGLIKLPAILDKSYLSNKPNVITQKQNTVDSPTKLVQGLDVKPASKKDLIEPKEFYEKRKTKEQELEFDESLNLEKK